MTDQIATTGTDMTMADLAANNVALVHEVHELQHQVAILQAAIQCAHDELESIVSSIEETLKEANR